MKPLVPHLGEYQVGYAYLGAKVAGAERAGTYRAVRAKQSLNLSTIIWWMHASLPLLVCMELGKGLRFLLLVWLMQQCMADCTPFLVF